MIYNFDDFSFKLLTIDKFQHKPGYFKVKARPYSAFSYRLSGEGRFEIDGKNFTVRPGDVIFIPEGAAYNVEYSVSESIVVTMNGSSYTDSEHLTFENHAAIGLMFQSLLDAWGENRSVNQAKSMIYSILDKMAHDKNPSVASGAFSKCLRYVDEHFCDPDLDVDKMRAVSFMSPSSLQRAFVQHFGISPNKYLVKLRMHKALELLTEDRLTVREIALACGFADEKYFSRVFKERYGCPPSHLKTHITV
jgi:AraC-like DNA-binding protein/mannose-6-phosphate isomerase-like protein (cupin superfamily)